MCKRKIISTDETDKNLVTVRQIEKVKPNLKVIVNNTHKAVIFKDGIVLQVLTSGSYKPFSKNDKNSRISIVFVNIDKSDRMPFATRVSQIMDHKSSLVYNAGFSGGYVFSIRNERKFLGTCELSGNDFTAYDFATRIEREVNTNVLSYATEYFSQNRISFREYKKHIDEMGRYVLVHLDKYLDDNYGIELRNIDFDNIILEDMMVIK